MPSKSEQRQDFNTTFIIAIIVAAILAFCVLGLVYGCMKANHAPQAKPPTAGLHLVNGQAEWVTQNG
ncbi:MAG: hypothetical protein DMG65_13420 [Candidatus Angelobacter sp. Gp1-AA117]|nr:MAG: hypothetical protein DMG65_13420 [Candidatus Angelobacter sp. Gp1-AA117]